MASSQQFLTSKTSLQPQRHCLGCTQLLCHGAGLPLWLGFWGESSEERELTPLSHTPTPTKNPCCPPRGTHLSLTLPDSPG